MPPHSTADAEVSQHDAYPRNLNRLEKQFVSHNARIAAAVTFTKEPRPRAEVVGALEAAIQSHPISFAHLDTDAKKLDWHAPTQDTPTTTPNFVLESMPLPTWASSEGQGLPHQIIGSQTSNAPLVLVLLSISADSIGGVVISASHALLGGAALKPIVEQFIANLWGPGNAAVSLDATSIPQPLSKAELDALVQSGVIPASYLPLDPRFHPPENDDTAVKRALLFQEKERSVEAAELKARFDVIKEEARALDALVVREHKQFTIHSKIQQVRLMHEADMWHTRHSELTAFEKALKRLSSSEFDARRELVADQTAELARLESMFRDRIEQLHADRKVVKYEAKQCDNQQHHLKKEARAVEALADRKRKQRGGRRGGGRGAGVVAEEARVLEHLGAEIRAAQVEMVAGAAALGDIAEREQHEEAVVAAEADNIRKRSLVARQQVKDYDRARQGALKDAHLVIQTQDELIQAEEDKWKGRAHDVARDAKAHAEQHTAVFEQHKAELRAAVPVAALCPLAGVPELRFLCPGDLVAFRGTPGVDEAQPEQRLVHLPFPTEAAASQHGQDTEFRAASRVAAALSIGFLAQAHARGIVRKHLDQGGKRIGIVFSIAAPFARTENPRLARVAESLPLFQREGVITAALVFEEFELRNGLDGPDSFAAQFDMSAIADRLFRDLRRRSDRGEGHRRALAFVDAVPRIASPTPLASLTFIGQVQAPTDDFTTSFEQIGRKGGEDFFYDGAALHILAWTGSRSGSRNLHLTLAVDNKAPFINTTQIICGAEMALGVSARS
jgi:hypothetical protein